jgi:isoamyl acetate esterase
MNFCVCSDGLHLSEEGSKIVVEEILKVLKEATDWDPCLHWKAMPTEFAEDSPYHLVSSSSASTVNPSEWTIHRTIPWD